MLCVQDVGFAFANLPLFSGVSFKVPPGRLLHLKGPNGVGKSTLMHILAGLLAPRSGTIQFSYADGTTKDLREVSTYLPSEGNGLFLRRDALSNLRYWSSLRGHPLSLSEATEALSRWGLTKTFFIRDFPVGKFSTGMKRRLALARVASSQAPLWLLDEPVYGLDQGAMATFRNLLSTHLRNGGCAVMISHDDTALSNLPHDILDLGSQEGARR